jgi:hypothetical protein
MKQGDIRASKGHVTRSSANLQARHPVDSLVNDIAGEWIARVVSQLEVNVLPVVVT